MGLYSVISVQLLFIIFQITLTRLARYIILNSIQPQLYSLLSSVFPPISTCQNNFLHSLHKMERIQIIWRKISLPQNTNRRRKDAMFFYSPSNYSQTKTFKNYCYAFRDLKRKYGNICGGGKSVYNMKHYSKGKRFSCAMTFLVGWVLTSIVSKYN